MSDRKTMYIGWRLSSGNYGSSFSAVVFWFAREVETEDNGVTQSTSSSTPSLSYLSPISLLSRPSTLSRILCLDSQARLPHTCLGIVHLEWPISYYIFICNHLLSPCYDGGYPNVYLLSLRYRVIMRLIMTGNCNHCRRLASGSCMICTSRTK